MDFSNVDFSNLDSVLIPLLFCFLGLLLFVVWGQPRPQDASSQYDEFVPGFEESPDRLYALVYQRLQDDLSQSRLPFSSLKFGPRSLFAKRHIFSASCLYLEVRYQDLSYYVYAVPAPGGLHVSTWLFSRSLVLAEHPVMKWLLGWRQSRMTLFQFDITRLFHYVVSGALYGVLDELRQEQGLRPLEAFERRPVLRGFYGAMQNPVSDGIRRQNDAARDNGLLPVHHQPIHHQPVQQEMVPDLSSHPEREGVAVP